MLVAEAETALWRGSPVRSRKPSSEWRSALYRLLIAFNELSSPSSDRAKLYPLMNRLELRRGVSAELFHALLWVNLG